MPLSSHQRCSRPHPPLLQPRRWPPSLSTPRTCPSPLPCPSPRLLSPPRPPWLPSPPPRLPLLPTSLAPPPTAPRVSARWRTAVHCYVHGRIGQASAGGQASLHVQLWLTCHPPLPAVPIPWQTTRPCSWAALWRLWPSPRWLLLPTRVARRRRLPARPPLLRLPRPLLVRVAAWCSAAAGYACPSPLPAAVSGRHS